MLLAKLWDKIQNGIRRDIPANTPFLSPREQEMARYLFGDAPGLSFFGGFAHAERKMLVYLPEYLDEGELLGEGSPIACLHAAFYKSDTPTHRDFLGALMGSGIARETVGDICVGEGFADFFTTAEIAPYLLQNFTGAGRTAVRLSRIPLSDAHLPQPLVKVIHDTVSSTRLDSIVSSGFRIGRGLAADYIAAGKVAIDGLPVQKADKAIVPGSKISLRGMGKIELISAEGLTKKGRIPVVIHRYR